MIVEIDGRTPTLERLRALVLSGYGHFTAMQVRSRRVRGLALHLDRLAEGNRDVFGVDLDRDLVRGHIRHALDQDTMDASVRVLIQRPDGDAHPSVTVIVRPPVDLPDEPWRLQSVPYQRSVAHIKHLGDFGQSYYGRLVERNGYDEALLTGPDGSISEGSITNIGFLDGDSIVWPAAPLLRGITMRLLEAAIPSRHAPITLSDVGGFAGAFVSNSRGIAAVAAIDDLVLPVDPALMGQLTKAYDSEPWDEI